MKKDRSVFPYLVRVGSFVPISLLVQLAENGSPLDLRDPYPATFLSTISITSIHRRGHFESLESKESPETRAIYTNPVDVAAILISREQSEFDKDFNQRDLRAAACPFV